MGIGGSGELVCARVWVSARSCLRDNNLCLSQLLIESDTRLKRQPAEGARKYR